VAYFFGPPCISRVKIAKRASPLDSVYFREVLRSCSRQCSMQSSLVAGQWRHQDFYPGGTTNMFTEAGIRHRNVYMKKYDKLAHLITHEMAWSFQRQASVISIKTVNNIPLPIIGVREKIIYYARIETAKFFYMSELPGGARAPVPHSW